MGGKFIHHWVASFSPLHYTRGQRLSQLPWQGRELQITRPEPGELQTKPIPERLLCKPTQPGRGQGR